MKGARLYNGSMSQQPLGAAIIGTAHSHALGHMEGIRASKNWKLIGVAEPESSTLRRNTIWLCNGLY